jgi:hypothetical protein
MCIGEKTKTNTEMVSNMVLTTKVQAAMHYYVGTGCPKLLRRYSEETCVWVYYQNMDNKLQNNE